MYLPHVTSNIFDITMALYTLPLLALVYVCGTGSNTICFDFCLSMSFIFVASFVLAEAAIDGINIGGIGILPSPSWFFTIGKLSLHHTAYSYLQHMRC